MPSSIVCLSDDFSVELEQLQIYAHGEETKRTQDEQDDNVLFSTEFEASFEVPFVPNASLSTDLAPTIEAFTSCIDELDSSPNLEFFSSASFLLSGILRYFLDLKTPGSAGSAAAHHMYSPKTLIICQNGKYH